MDKDGVSRRSSSTIVGFPGEFSHQLAWPNRCASVFLMMKQVLLKCFILGLARVPVQEARLDGYRRREEEAESSTIF